MRRCFSQSSIMCFLKARRIRRKVSRPFAGIWIRLQEPLGWNLPWGKKETVGTKKYPMHCKRGNVVCLWLVMIRWTASRLGPLVSWQYVDSSRVATVYWTFRLYVSFNLLPGWAAGCRRHVGYLLFSFWISSSVHGPLWPCSALKALSCSSVTAEALLPHALRM